MTDMHTSATAEALVQAMETMAFTTPTWADASLSPAADSVLVSMPFSGPVSGTVEMVASEAVGAGLAANILAIAPNDPAAKRHARDTLKELLNVTCGLLLPTLVDSPSTNRPFKINLPRVKNFDSQTQWKNFVATSESCALNVNGGLIALRVKCDQ
jgi:hypothetical protein